MEHPCSIPPPFFFDSFNLRSDVHMGKQYLEGRYGGGSPSFRRRGLFRRLKGTDDMPPPERIGNLVAQKRIDSLRCFSIVVTSRQSLALHKGIA